MKVSDQLDPWERAKLFPGEEPRLIDFTGHLEPPGLPVDRRAHAQIEDGKARGQVLPRGKPPAFRLSFRLGRAGAEALQQLHLGGQHLRVVFLIAHSVSSPAVGSANRRSQARSACQSRSNGVT